MKQLLNRARLTRWAPTAVLMIFLLMTALPAAAETVNIQIPDLTPTGGGGADPQNALNKIFNTATLYLLYASGGVLVLVLVWIGFQLIMGGDARKRAETMEWLKWVILGSGLIFGSTFVARLLVGLYARALS